MPVLPAPTLPCRPCQASWSLVEEFNQQYEELLAQTLARVKTEALCSTRLGTQLDGQTS